jgi:hypothetical protein
MLLDIMRLILKQKNQVVNSFDPEDGTTQPAQERIL